MLNNMDDFFDHPFYQNVYDEDKENIFTGNEIINRQLLAPDSQRDLKQSSGNNRRPFK